MAKNNDYLIISQNTFTSKEEGGYFIRFPKNESNVVGIVILKAVQNEKTYLSSVDVRRFKKGKTGKNERLWIVQRKGSD